jgi:hypothetical protein
LGFVIQPALIVDPQELSDVLRAIVCEELAAVAPRNDDPWFDAEAAGAYLSMSPGAVQTAWTRGKLVYHLSETGQRRVRRSECDAYATAGDPA